MEEIYLLPDGSQEDLSNYSSFEKLNFLMENPGAKKLKGVAKSANATSKKKAQDMGSKQVDGSLGSQKYRLPNDNDLETMQKRGLAPPPSAQPRSNVDVKNIYGERTNFNKDYENLLGSLGKDNQKQRFDNLDKKKKSKTLSEDLYDLKPNSTEHVNSIEEVANLRNKIQETDSDLLHPYLYYSSQNKENPDNFVDENYNKKELESFGVNSADFDGFLNKKGFKQDYLDKEQKGLFEGQGSSFFTGQDYQLSKELAKKRMLNLYMEDMQRRDYTRQDLNQEIEVVSGYRDKKEIVNNQLFDNNQTVKYVEKNFPVLTQKLKERDEENRKLYQESKEGGTDFWSWETPVKMGKAGWNAVIDRLDQVSPVVYEKLGMSTIAEGIRMNAEQTQLSRPDDRGFAYASGKLVKYEGTNYIVDSKGQIYDKDSKIRVTDLFEKSTYEKILSDSKYAPSDWTFSTQGAATQTAGVMADMLLQAAVTKGIGSFGTIATETRLALNGAQKATKFTSLLNDTSSALRMIPLPRAEGYSMIAQSALGYTQGYEDTLKTARENGINDADAFKLASFAAQNMAVLYAATTPINPQTNVVENVFGSKNLIKKAIEQYTKTGEKGFVNYLTDVVKNAPKNIIEFAEEGGKEVIQENIQQVGEIGVNMMVNKQAGKKLMNDVMSGDDFMNTSILSFISSGMISKIKMPSFHSSDENVDDLMSLSTLAKNKKEFTKTIDGLVNNKVFTVDQAESLKKDVDIYANNINKVLKNTSPDTAMPIMRELDKITKLENEKTSVDKAFHPKLDEQIKGIRQNIVDIQYESDLKVKNKAISDAISKGVAKGTQMKSFSSTDSVKEYLMNEVGMSESTAKAYLAQPGFALNSKTLKKYSKDPDSIADNSQVIVVNESLTKDAGVIQHEFLHGVLQNTLKDNPELQKLVGSALGAELQKINQSLKNKGSDEQALPEWFSQRIGQYINRESEEKGKALARYQTAIMAANDDPSKVAQAKAEYTEDVKALQGVVWEEALTIYSDALRRGYVTYNESTFTKLGDVIRRVLQNLGIRNIKFNSGKDVYNFLKDYNNSVETGNWGKALTKMSNEGAEINIKPLTKTTTQETKPKDNSKFSTTEKFSLSERKSSEDIKKDVNKNYDKEKWSTGSNSKGENPAIDRVLFDILGEYDYIIKGKARALRYDKLPGYEQDDSDMIAETKIALIPHVRNFNKEFFEKREEYKKQLEAKGLDPKSQEFKDKVEAQDEKGYQGKKGIVKENNDLNAWINSQLVNKMGNALRTGNVTTKKFTEDIEGEMFKESSISDGFRGDEGYLMDEGDSIFEAEQDYAIEQNNLAVLLSDPVFRFTDENGKALNIETIPFNTYVTSITDPGIAANIKLKTETDPDKIIDLKKQLKDLERGLELESKEDITPEEKKELKSLRSFKSYDLSSGEMINTFKALSIENTPVKIITEEISREIFRSPNIETLEYRNFKEMLSDISKTMARRMTFKNGPEIESFMYNQWKLIYDIINHPVDPITGESSYSSKKIPPTLKEVDEKGNIIKIKDINRIKFLQAFYEIEDVIRIIKTYGGTNADKELKQLQERELNEKTGKPLSQNAHFDRRTALMELFGDVMVLQEARRLLRQPDFLEIIGERNVNLYNELKDDVIRAKVLNDMAKGKSDIVKFTLAEEENGNLSDFLQGLPFTEQWVVARDIDNAIRNSKAAEGTKVTFKVPSRSKMSDKSTAYFIIEKVAEGYNDFEFKVKKNANGPLTAQVLNALDFKSKKYQETVERNNNIERTINEFIEENKGVSAEETFSPETAKNLGKNIDKYKIYLPPEDEDFEGLLYTLAGAKGKKGNEQLEFLRDNLLKPYSEAMLNLMKARQTMYKDWKDLINKKHKGINKLLKSDSGYGGYLVDQAVRVYLWKKARYEIPGLDKKDIFNLLEIVRTNPKLRSFADDVSLLSKQANGWSEPGNNWGFGSVVGDINNIISKSNRKKYLEQWTKNVDKAFSKENMSKIEAVYGRKYAIALKNSLDRMKTGTNRVEGSNDKFLNWLNGATAVTMFANMRSAVLQLLGAVNFINTSDNNILKAAKALINVPQYTKDFFTIWNSDYLKDRRSGLTNDVAEAELAQLMNDPRNGSVLDKFKAANYWMLKKGYGPTRFADSFAIAFGGAGFYRNRMNTYKKSGMTEEEANKVTMKDFYQVSESSQQSADVSKISMNQASVKGRLILAFQNTPLQYSRLIKRSVVDLIKGRGSVPNNIAKILYYGAIQNIMFNFMQNALFSMLWDDDDEQVEGKFDTAKMRAISGTMDTLLRGAGLQGAMLATVKNIIVKWYEKSGDPKGFGDVVLEAANLSPSIGIKLRALSKSYKAIEYNMDEIKYKGFSIDNTYAIEALTSLTSASINLPVDRLMTKVENVHAALNADYEVLQRVALLFGYSTWNLGLEKSANVELDSRSNLKNIELKDTQLKGTKLK